MIKMMVKSKKLEDGNLDTNVKYKVKNTCTEEHLIVIAHLYYMILENSGLEEKELNKLIKQRVKQIKENIEEKYGNN